MYQRIQVSKFENMNNLIGILLLYVLSTVTGTVRYDNFSVYRIVPEDTRDLVILKSLQESQLKKFNFWTPPNRKGKSADLLVAPTEKSYIESVFSRYDIDFKVMIENIQEMIDEEARISKAATDDEFGWDKYYSLEQIYDWLKKLAADNPDTVTLIEGGRSYENRTILGVKVSFGPENRNRGVWIDSNIHAREWISSATNTFMLNAILYSDDPIVRATAESHDWYIFPVINPDGYEYSRTNDRVWRKNRAPVDNNCYGTDLNRNWDYKWNQDGSGSDPCNEVYAGAYAFSEVESKTLSEYISSIGHNLVLYLTLHSYSQQMLIPFSDRTEHAANYNVTYPAGLKGAEALAVRYGTIYEVGNTAEICYVSYGCSDDWSKATFNIPFLYAFELRDTGTYGFLLPPEQIVPSGLETLDAVVAILEEADKYY